MNGNELVQTFVPKFLLCRIQEIETVFSSFSSDERTSFTREIFNATEFNSRYNFAVILGPLTFAKVLKQKFL